MNIEAIHTNFANFIIAHEYNKLYSLDFTNVIEGKLSPFAKYVKDELNEYFAGTRKQFSIEYILNLSNFATYVFQELSKVQYGSTVYYKDIAKMINKPNASRAVGNVMAINPIPIIIPCHRVVATNGLGGYSYGSIIKLRLLELEGVDVSSYKCKY